MRGGGEGEVPSLGMIYSNKRATAGADENSALTTPPGLPCRAPGHTTFTIYGLLPHIVELFSLKSLPKYYTGTSSRILRRTSKSVVQSQKFVHAKSYRHARHQRLGSMGA